MEIEPTHTDVIDEPTPLEKTNSSEAEEQSLESKSEYNEDPKLDITNGEVNHMEPAVEETASQVDQLISETNVTEDMPVEEVSDKPESISQVENEASSSKPDQNITKSEDIAPAVEETKPEPTEDAVKETQVESSASQVVEEVNTKSVETEDEKPEEPELKGTEEKTD
ncbi:hypothetical protein K7432_008110 [Basidiobolus ranarum]|uniref:Uncharacterized protein n=1 Tax=Basidiobolus ranarum TaxID=34480 RepID=A0ABR2VZI4_9FUNG